MVVRALPALAFYVLLTAVFGRHVVAQLGSSVANDAGDPLLTAAILYWNAHHVPLTDAWWQFPIFHPTRDALAFSEHLLGLSVVASPIAWLTGDPLVTYNLTMLSTFPLCAMAMYALVFHLTRSHAAGFVAGLAYGFAPYRLVGLSHVQMLASFWAPLALIGLHRFVHGGPSGVDAAGEETAHDAVRPDTVRGRLHWLALFGGAWALQGLANGYMLVFFSVLVALWIVWFVVLPGRWRALAAITAATVIAAIPFVPVLTKYVAVHARHGFERTAVEMQMFSADLGGLLCAADDLTFWGWLRYACRPEGALFPGLGTACLFVGGLTLWLRRAGTPLLPADGRPAIGRTVLVWASRVCAAVAALYAAVLAWLLLVGPLRIELGVVRISASEVAKPAMLAAAAALCAFVSALAARFEPRRPPVLGFYLFAALVAWSCALGPSLFIADQPVGRSGPFALLQLLPGVTGLRVPARFWLVAVLALSVVSGMTIARLRRILRPNVSVAVVALVSGVLVGDVWTRGFDAAPAPASAPDSAALRGEIVLSAPFDVFADAAATFRAVAGGWRSINGTSGYLPNYYAAAALGVKSGDTLVPFRRRHDLHVLVPDAEPALQAVMALQAGLLRVAQGRGWRQYHFSRLAEPAEAVSTHRVPIVAATSTCNSHVLRFAFDNDPATAWQCPVAERIEITLDLGMAVPVGALVFSVGPYWWVVPERFTIAASADGSAWSAVETPGIVAALIEGGLRDSRSLTATLPFAPRQARYLRLQASGAVKESSWLVSELEVRAAN